MHSTYTWNMFHLFGRKIAFLAILLAFSYDVDAQSARGNYNFLDFQQKPYYFGITLGYNSLGYNVFRSKEFLQSQNYQGVTNVSGPGFNLGIVTNLKVGDYFDFRFLPTLSFAERNIEYDLTGDNPQTRKIQQVLVETPFHIRYKSAPYRDIRLFVIAGVKYTFDVANDSRSRQADSLVKIAPTDFAAEYGAGIQFFFPYFIFSPEFKISHGISNSLLFDNNLEESTILDKVMSRAFTISLHFEG